MALNKYMHPRNPYKEKKPDFKALALKYEEFRKHTTQDSKEHVHLDFKKPECMRALSWALLKEDFGLDIEMPLNRLIPAIPLRLNYILWIEDLLAEKHDNIKGIDIGTGASCVYPLLAAKKNSWKFLATEADDFNTEYAKRNVAKNALQDAIQVLQVSSNTKLCGVVDVGDTYDFCMCNPPFFGSNLEAWGMLTSRSEERPEPKSVSTAAPQESIVVGGEVAFVKQIILDSLELRGRVRIYTTMLGKKSSLAPLKAELRKHGITRFGTTELCQGRTMRWALGWTFDDHVVFKPPISKSGRHKTRPPLLIKLPCPCGATDTAASRVWRISDKVIQLLNQLQMTHKVTDPTVTSRKWQVSARQNTWSHQRRKRRQMEQQASRGKQTKCDGQPHIVTVADDRLGQDAVVSSSFRTHNGQGDVTTTDSKFGDSPGHLVTEVTGSGDISTGRVNGWDLDHGGTDDVGVAKKGGDSKGGSHKERGGYSKGMGHKEGVGDSKGGGEDSKGGGVDSKGVGHKEGSVDNKGVGHKEEGGKGGDSKDNKQGEEHEYLLRFSLTVTQEQDSVVLQFTWVDGRSYDLLHQVVQFFRNRLQ